MIFFLGCQDENNCITVDESGNILKGIDVRMETNSSKTVAELKVAGDLFVNGNQVKGVKTTTWATHYLIEVGVLEELLIMQSVYSVMKKSVSYIINLIQPNKTIQNADGDKQLMMLRAEVSSLCVDLKEAEKTAETALRKLSLVENLSVELHKARVEIELLQDILRERKVSGGSENDGFV